MLVFVDGGKPENPEKTPRGNARTDNKLNPHAIPRRIRTRSTLEGDKHSQHYAALLHKLQLLA